MKLLLTSNGLSNYSIAMAFRELVGKDPQKTKIAFIPTAANPDRSNKEWLINDLYRIKQQGYYIDIIDLPALSETELENALDEVDVIFVGGGNTFYLSYWMQKSGLMDMLPRLLNTKVYAGISAGSIIAGTSLALSSPALKNPEAFKDGDYDLVGPKGASSSKTLNLVNFVFRPHLNSRYFNLVRKELLEQKAKEINYSVYALDDDSALKIIGDSIEVISEGEWTLIEVE
jgi:dipeptidase E